MAISQLAADPGSYAITGTDASLEYGRIVAASSGSYAITGTAATFHTGKAIIAAAGSYSITGSAASFVRTRKIAADSGFYAINGSVALLRISPATSIRPSVSIDETSRIVSINRAGRTIAGNSSDDL